MAHRILVVEDDAAIMLFLIDVLQRLDYVVVGTAATGRDAIRLAAAKTPDLILMDISLAGRMTGIQAASQIREHLDIPIIFATAHSDETTLEAVQQAEPYGFVLKPYDQNELRVAIEIAIHKHRVDQSLRRSEQRFAMTLKAIAEAVISTHQSGVIDFYNDSAERLTGIHSIHAVGSPVADVVKLIDSTTEGPLAMAQGWNGEALVIDSNGTRIPVTGSIANIAADGGSSLGQVLVLRDVREQRRIAEFQESQRVQHLIEEFSETERRRFGQELHDSLGQMLTGAAFRCRRLEEQLSAHSHDESLEAARIGKILSEAIQGARDISQGLLPVPDRPDGLAMALEQLAEQVITRFEIECDFTDASSVSVSNPGVANHLFRICQEAVNNAVKHGSPRRIEIHLQTENGRGILTVCDDGAGIRADSRFRGRGLDIMRQRAATIGGTLNVAANEGGGTMVVCAFALESQ